MTKGSEEGVRKLAGDNVALANKAKRTLKDHGLWRTSKTGGTWYKPDILTPKDELQLTGLFKTTGHMSFSSKAFELGFKPAHIRKFMDDLKTPKTKIDYSNPPPEVAGIKDAKERMAKHRELVSKLQLEKALEKWKV